MANGTDRIDVNTGLFGLRLSGPNALITFLFIIILGLMGLTIWAHGERSREHEELSCMIKLNLYVNSIPRGEPLDWSKMPVDLYACVPRFLYERGASQR
jgi:hypothetical protein